MATSPEPKTPRTYAELSPEEQAEVDRIIDEMTDPTKRPKPAVTPVPDQEATTTR